MPFVIEHPEIRLKVSLEPVDRLLIHEEIIEPILRRLVDEIRADGVFKHPVIVDEKTMVVLDGMHRVAAAKELGLRLIPTCLVDYDNPNIRVFTWCRSLKGENLDRVLDVIRDLGMKLSDSRLEEALGKLGREGVVGILLSTDRCLVIHAPCRNLKQVYEEVKRIESALKSKGYEVVYLTEGDALEMASSGRVLASIIPPPVSKQDVRRVALRGEVFAHKTTRHVIPARPMFVNVPLEWLTMEYERANKLLHESLSTRGVRRLPPGSVLDRRYEEELYVFE